MDTFSALVGLLGGLSMLRYEGEFWVVVLCEEILRAEYHLWLNPAATTRPSSPFLYTLAFVGKHRKGKFDCGRTTWRLLC